MKCIYCGREIQNPKWGQLYCTQQCKKNAERLRRNIGVTVRGKLMPELIRTDCFAYNEENGCMALNATYCGFYKDPCPFYKKKDVPEGAMVCPICGQPFFQGRSDQIYCSMYCRNSAYAKIKYERLKERRNNEQCDVGRETRKESRNEDIV